MSSQEAEWSTLGVCLNKFGEFQEVGRLNCVTEPALLKSLAPDLEFPSCSDTNRGPEIVPSYLPTGAIFIGCSTYDIAATCGDIARELLRHPTDATVNLMVESSAFLDDENLALFLELDRLATKKGTPLNFIPINPYPKVAHIRLEPALFLRDPGIFMTDQASDHRYLALPYTTLGKASEDSIFSSMLAWEETLRSCGFPVMDPIYANQAEMLNTYSIYEGIIALGNEELDLLQRPDMDRLIRGYTHRELARHYQTNNSDYGGDSEMGGNFLALPGGKVALGTMAYQAPSKALLGFFRDRGLEPSLIELPRLAVGHIDEVFNLVPGPEPCGFTVLRASPLKMKELLTTRNPKEHLYAIPKGVEALPDKNMTVGRALSDLVLMQSWKKSQADINKATEQLFELILDATSGMCIPEVIDLPVFWSTGGRAVLPNPVNGLSVNGSYFYSEPTALVWDNDSSTEKKQKLPYTHNFIEKAVMKALRPVFGSQVYTVPTPKHDRGSGNLHCATTDIHLPCVP